MATYGSASRTNYFKVTDIERLKEIVGKISCEDNVELWDGKDGTYAFGAYGDITDYYDEETDEYESIVPDLQKILPDGEICIITSAGNEKLRYIVGFSWLITNKEDTIIDLENHTIELARKMLNDPNKEIELNY